MEMSVLENLDKLEMVSTSFYIKRDHVAVAITNSQINHEILEHIINHYPILIKNIKQIIADEKGYASTEEIVKKLEKLIE